jgi:hypothetical protein
MPSTCWKWLVFLLITDIASVPMRVSAAPLEAIERVSY